MGFVRLNWVFIFVKFHFHFLFFFLPFYCWNTNLRNKRNGYLSLFFSSLLLRLCGADVSTDGKWCYIVFWVIGKSTTRWSLLERRLLEACPACASASGFSYFQLQPPKPPNVFLLKFCCYDRKGLLHGTSFLGLSNSIVS